MDIRTRMRGHIFAVNVYIKDYPTKNEIDFQDPPPCLLSLNTRVDTRKGIQLIQQHWDEEFPVALFDYSFLDDFYNQQYGAEIRLRKPVAFFAVIVMVLTCVGLFSLLKFSLDSRMKEISIKRTLGASIRGIMVKLSSEFLALVGISLVIEFLASWFIANQNPVVGLKDE